MQNPLFSLHISSKIRGLNQSWQNLQSSYSGPVWFLNLFYSAYNHRVCANLNCSLRYLPVGGSATHTLFLRTDSPTEEPH